MTTITIVPEIEQKKLIYKAICGNQETIGLTPGQALDLMETSLITEGELMDETLVILQRFRGDDLFTKQQQEQLQELMEEFHQSLASETEFSAIKQQELTALAEAELEASIQRGTRIIKKIKYNS